ncbi:unnamed protein product [Symbiodinium natans]|uniref:Uncharacterized protein n=1 Tax=Symbiodinium natans TaxID=878477 RepID=A0A812RIC6_9DINO|nr:unnamed protein product [Symbiodinium natans]
MFEFFVTAQRAQQQNDGLQLSELPGSMTLLADGEEVLLAVSPARLDHDRAGHCWPSTGLPHEFRQPHTLRDTLRDAGSMLSSCSVRRIEGCPGRVDMKGTSCTSTQTVLTVLQPSSVLRVTGKPGRL